MKPCKASQTDFGATTYTETTCLREERNFGLSSLDLSLSSRELAGFSPSLLIRQVRKNKFSGPGTTQDQGS